MTGFESDAMTAKQMMALAAKGHCYDIKPVRKEEGKFYWKITLGEYDATREK